MIIKVNRQQIARDYLFVEMTCGKKTAFVSHNQSLGQINVTCDNAAHKAWKGFGKYFRSWEEAKENYRSAEILAMIEHVEAIHRGVHS